jgi:hypothetical protein
LPAGITVIDREIAIPASAHDLEIRGSANTVLRMSSAFEGRAVFAGEQLRNVRFSRFVIEGDPAMLQIRSELIPPENAFRVKYSRNGILLDQSDGIQISDVAFRSIPSFAVLVSRSRQVKLDRVSVSDSGTLNAKGRNNTTGGILFEDGVNDFELTNSLFRRIRGNAFWTHSQRTAARSEKGAVRSSDFDTVGRDAIQIGHATRISVSNNTGVRIGYPPEVVDNENQATPVAIDTAGNVDQSIYSRNSFRELNGKCFDLDGFHHGEVSSNRCVNQGSGEQYPNGHFGIVLNNNDPGMKSEAIRIVDNEIVKAKLGGLFLIGSGHEVRGNRFLDVNTIGCPQAGAVCLYVPSEPKLLSSGIYLSKGVLRLEDTRGNRVEQNRITGHGMRSNCVNAGPGVSIAANQIRGNVCEER